MVLRKTVMMMSVMVTMPIVTIISMLVFKRSNHPNIRYSCWWWCCSWWWWWGWNGGCHLWPRGSVPAQSRPTYNCTEVRDLSWNPSPCFWKTNVAMFKIFVEVAFWVLVKIEIFCSVFISKRLIFNFLDALASLESVMPVRGRQFFVWYRINGFQTWNL